MSLRSKVRDGGGGGLCWLNYKNIRNYLEKKEYKKKYEKGERIYAMRISKIEFNKIMIIIIYFHKNYNKWPMYIHT